MQCPTTSTVLKNRQYQLYASSKAKLPCPLKRGKYLNALTPTNKKINMLCCVHEMQNSWMLLLHQPASTRARLSGTNKPTVHFTLTNAWFWLTRQVWTLWRTQQILSYVTDSPCGFHSEQCWELQLNILLLGTNTDAMRSNCSEKHSIHSVEQFIKWRKETKF